MKCPVCKEEVVALVDIEARTKFKSYTITFEGRVCIKCRNEIKEWGVVAILKKL